MAQTTWSELKAGQKVGVVIMGLIQISLFVAAWRDLSGRSAKKVNGNKKVWRGALFLNIVGPLAYFFKGRKQSDLDGGRRARYAW